MALLFKEGAMQREDSHMHTKVTRFVGSAQASPASTNKTQVSVLTDFLSANSL